MWAASVLAAICPDAFCIFIKVEGTHFNKHFSASFEPNPIHQAEIILWSKQLVCMACSHCILWRNSIDTSWSTCFVWDWIRFYNITSEVYNFGLQCHIGSSNRENSNSLYQMSDHLIFYRAFSFFSVLTGCQRQLLRAGGPAYTGSSQTAPKNLPVRTYAAVKWVYEHCVYLNKL